jgi:penicillin-binding protein 2
MQFKRGWALLVGLVLAACSGGAGGAAPNIAVPLLGGGKSPADMVSEFLDNWKAKNYPAMYAALSQESQGTIDATVFQKVYEEVDQKISLKDMRYTVKTSQVQGAAAAVTYDLSLDSPIFGTIDDPGRIMRLIQKQGGGWGIAWSTMDIFDAMAGGARLEVKSRLPERANILDRNGKVLVEQGGTVIALYVSKDKMSNVDDCLDVLANVLMKQRYDLEALFAQNNNDTVFYVGDIDPETNDARAADLDGICSVRRVERETRRYVGHGAAVHVTGYVGSIPATSLEALKSKGYSAGDLIGLTGVEAQFEPQLRGQPERYLQITAPSGIALRQLAGQKGQAAQSVTLTIDRDLQLATAQAVSDAFNYAQPNWAGQGISTGAGAVVLDVRTGEVLALASYPYFDPGLFNSDTPMPGVGEYIGKLQNDPRQPFKDRVTQEQYFPGSTFKIITTVAAASERVWNPTDQFPCDLQWDGKKYGDTIGIRTDWRVIDSFPAAGPITMAQALMASCNPFFYEMGAKLYQKNPNALLSYARKLGLGEKTGLDPILPEATGDLTPPNSVERAINNGIGQQVQVTIIQMARMVAAIANGGTVYRPYIVERVGGDDGGTPSQTFKPVIEGSADLRQDVLDVVHQGMCGVTTNKDLGTAYDVFEGTTYTVCGKTGTAQTGRQEPFGWFVAYAPADNPQVAVVVMVEYGREGSETAAPIVRRVLDYYFGAEWPGYPRWWNKGPYHPIVIPEGSTGG